MKQLREFYIHVQAKVNSCPSLTMNWALQLACREFTMRTKLWRPERVTIQTVANQADYTLSTVDYDIAEIRSVHVNGQEYDIKNVEEAEQLIDDGDRCLFAYLNTDGVTLTLNPAPTEADQDIVYRVIAMSKLTATSVPDQLVDQFANDIAAGALMHLYEMKDQDWTDPERYSFYFDKFNDRIRAVALKTARGFSRARRNVTAKYF